MRWIKRNDLLLAILGVPVVAAILQQAGAF